MVDLLDLGIGHRGITFFRLWNTIVLINFVCDTLFTWNDMRRLELTAKDWLKYLFGNIIVAAKYYRVTLTLSFY